jgi:uncharacterized protein YcaQ
LNIEIDRAGARALLLAAQGFAPESCAPTKDDVLSAIRTMGVLQIDTIHVVARSQLLVLWSRLGSVDPVWLDELLAEGKLFEYWAHAICFLPIEDFRLYRPAMLHRRAGSERDGWLSQHPEVVEQVLNRVGEKGEVRSSEFERPEGGGGWWNHKPEKSALEELFLCGTLMIARREGFQRVYARQERVLPGWSDAELPSQEELERTWTVRAVRSLGLTPARWVPDYYRRPKKGAAERLARLAEEGALHVARVPDLGGEPFYFHPDHLHLVQAAADGDLHSPVTTLLSPFDPVVWDRARGSELFEFDYKIEVYTPAEKRKFGYFTLPILHRGELVGRLCPKAHRQQGVFEIRQLHLEPGCTITDDLVAGLAGALQRCADWHRTPEVVIRDSDPPALAAGVRAALGDRLR